MIKKIITEPLVHFIVLGALVFVLYGWLNQDAPAQDRIVVTRGQQEHLINVFGRTWQRSPTESEFAKLLQDYVREELAYREGVALGFDEGDTIIRRRMRQKLELLTDELVSLAEPTQDELEAFLRANTDRFRTEAEFDLRHIYISSERRGVAAESDAQAMLDQLNSDPASDWSTMGDPLALGDAFTGISVREFERLFGQQFAQGIQQGEQGRWAGPVESGFGLHLVFVDNLIPARDPSLDEVRQQVASELAVQRRDEATELLYQRLAENYSIEIEPLEASPDS